MNVPDDHHRHHAPVAWTGRVLALAGLLASAALFSLILAGAIAGSVGHQSDSQPPTTHWGALLLSTIAVAVGIGTAATLLALPAAWLIRSLRFRWIGLLCAPLLLPTYIIYASWNLLRAPGAALGDRLAALDPVWDTTFGHAIAIGGLALWAWPIAALIIGARARRIDDDVLDSLRLTAGSRFRRSLVLLGLLRGSIIASITVITAIMLGSAVPLHVAQVPTYAIHLWRTLSETAGSAAAWHAAWPLVLVAVMAGWTLGGALTGMSSRTSQPGVAGPAARRRGVAAPLGAAAVWALAVLVPLALLLNSLSSTAAIRHFWLEDAPIVLETTGNAALTALFALPIVFAVALGLSPDAPATLRRLTRWSLRLWIIGALLPGVLVGQALVEAAAWPGLHWIADTRAGLILAHLIRFGAIAALAGWWMAWIEPDALRSARRLFAGDGLRAWLSTSARLEAGVILGAVLAVGLLSLHEIEAAVILAPPGYDLLSQRILSLLHYLHDENLSATVIHLLLGGILIATVAGMTVGRSTDAWNRMHAS
ncbi:MAG: hypothetical protein KDA21_04900 [Phycisphaerales bacterium]|nr:hypothetical protein [Phycisphaerales bacterium]